MLQRILKPIVAEFGNYSIGAWVVSKEGGDLPVEILDVFFGPLNLCKTTLK
jgi:hypothetical protein